MYQVFFFKLLLALLIMNICTHTHKLQAEYIYQLSPRLTNATTQRPVLKICIKYLRFMNATTNLPVLFSLLVVILTSTSPSIWKFEIDGKGVLSFLGSWRIGYDFSNKVSGLWFEALLFKQLLHYKYYAGI